MIKEKITIYNNSAILKEEKSDKKDLYWNTIIEIKDIKKDNDDMQFILDDRTK